MLTFHNTARLAMRSVGLMLEACQLEIAHLFDELGLLPELSERDERERVTTGREFLMRVQMAAVSEVDMRLLSTFRQVARLVERAAASSPCRASYRADDSGSMS